MIDMSSPLRIDKQTSAILPGRDSIVRQGDRYTIKDGKKLRLGYTTGSCAAAAAKAAAWMLLTGGKKERILLDTPKGIRLDLPVLQIERGVNSVSCAIEKDSGDDPDVTKGTLIFASVSYLESPEIIIDGGEGVGRVTKRGLDQPVGAAAINSVPRRMIRENLEEICRMTDYHGGLSVTISVPEGEEIAKKTFNARLGILGGISILGTTGIVEPMSEQALIDTIRVEDCRMEILAAYAGASGLDASSVSDILSCATCDDAIRILDESGTRERTLERLAERISFIINNRVNGAIKTGAILFSKQYGFLCETKCARLLLRKITEE